MFTEEEKLAFTCGAQSSQTCLTIGDGISKGSVDGRRQVPGVGVLAWGSRQGRPETPYYCLMMLSVLAAYPEQQTGKQSSRIPKN